MKTFFLAAVGALACSVAHAKAEIEKIRVTGHQIEQSNYSDIELAESLARLPGSAMVNNGPATSLSYYRGLMGTRVPVVFAGIGMPQAGPNAMDAPLSMLLPGQAFDIKQLQGVVPVSYGAEMISGGFAVDPIWQAPDKNQLQVSNLPSHSGYQTAIDLGAVLEEAYWRFGAQRQKGDKRQSGSGEMLPNQDYDRWSSQVTTGWAHDAHRLDSYVAVQRTQHTGTPALAMDINFIDAFNWRLRYQWQGADEKITLTGFGNNTDHLMDNVSMRTSMMKRQNRADLGTYGLSVKWQKESENTVWTSGAEWVTAEHQSDISDPANPMFFINNFNQSERDRWSVFVDSQLAYSEANALRLGIRVGQVMTDTGNIDSSMAMMMAGARQLRNLFNQADKDLAFNLYDLTIEGNHDLNGELQWFWQAGHKMRAPDYTQLYLWLPLGISGGMADGYNYVGNLDLEPEALRQLEFGVRWQREANSWELRLFDQAISDYITGSPSANAAANMVSMMMSSSVPLQWTNTDASIHGAELSWHASVNQSLQWQGVLQWSKGRQSIDGSGLFRHAPASLVQDIRYYDGKLNSYLRWYLFASQNNVAEYVDETTTSGYGYVDVGAEYHINQQLLVHIQISNLFDREFVSHTSGINRVMNSALAVGESIPSAGREFQLSLKYYW